MENRWFTEHSPSSGFKWHLELRRADYIKIWGACGLPVGRQNNNHAILVKNNQTPSILEIPIDGVFVEIGLDSNAEFVKPLIELNSKNEIPIGMDCETSVPGLWAAGDVTEIYQNQIIIAAGEGAKAALGAFEYLMRMDKDE